MKDLHQFDYVLYDPSYNPFRGSLVTIINMELKSEQIRKTKRQQVNKQTSSKQELNKRATSSEQALVPSINNINAINNTNKENKNIATAKNKILVSPTFIEVETYFVESKVTKIEAQKFFNYYESNGWKIGGRSPMKN